jgi:hypothetical protein
LPPKIDLSERHYRKIQPEKSTLPASSQLSLESRRGYVTGGQMSWFKRICKQLGEMETYMSTMSDLPETLLERDKMIENILVTACEGHCEGSTPYEELRRLFIVDSVLKPLLPDFVRICRDLSQ